MAHHAPQGGVAADPADRPVSGWLGRVREQAAGDGGPALGVYAALVAAVVIALTGPVGVPVHQPWLFPSLGPTLMVIAETPRQPAAHPRNVLVGHVVAVAAGWLAPLGPRLGNAPPRPPARPAPP